MEQTSDTRTEKGISLARGPALILGTVLLVAGLYFLYKQHAFPKLANFPDGKAPVDGKVFFGIFGANGWTGMLTAIGGGLLLFGAAQHLLAKAMSLIVGVALGAAAIIALVSGSVLGLAAANGWTEIGWGVVAAILLFNTVIPRRRSTVAVQNGVAAERTRTAAPVGARTQGQAAEPSARREEPVTDRGAAPNETGGASTAGTETRTMPSERAVGPGEGGAERRTP